MAILKYQTKIADQSIVQLREIASPTKTATVIYVWDDALGQLPVEVGGMKTSQILIIAASVVICGGITAWAVEESRADAARKTANAIVEQAEQAKQASLRARYAPFEEARKKLSEAKTRLASAAPSEREELAKLVEQARKELDAAGRKVFGADCHPGDTRPCPCWIGYGPDRKEWPDAKSLCDSDGKWRRCAIGCPVMGG